MIRTKDLFAVSVMTILVVGSANANIASQAYVDEIVENIETNITGESTGSGNVITEISASGNTVSATRGITAEETKNKVSSIRDTSTATDTAYPSEKAVATALAAKADAGDYATNDALDAVRTTAQSAASDAAEAVAAVESAVADKITANAPITGGTATKITYDDKGLVTAGANLTADDIPQISTTKVSGLGTLATKSAVASADITDGTIVNADIAADAAIAQSKISGLETALAAKADSSSLAPVATSGSYNDLQDKPAIPSAYTLPVATSSALGGVKSGGNITVGTDGAVTVNQATNATSATSATSATKATQDASGNVITSTYATKAEVSALTSSSTGSGAVVTNVTQTGGKVSVTKGNVQIPVGSSTATSYASIWVE